MKRYVDKKERHFFWLVPTCHHTNGTYSESQEQDVADVQLVIFHGSIN